MEVRIIDAKVLPKKFKKWSGGALVVSLFMFLVIRYCMMKNPIGESPLAVNASNSSTPLQAGVPLEVQKPEDSSQVISADILVSSLFVQRNLSDKVQSSLQTWNHMKNIINYAQGLPNAVEAIREAVFAWDTLLNISYNEEKSHVNNISLVTAKEKQCPYFLNKMDATEFGNRSFRLRIPCGLIQGSAITVIGIPNVLENFRIDLTGETLPEEPNPPLLLHYNVRLKGDNVTKDLVIVQNTWTVAHGWGKEERCPSAVLSNKKVDELKQCNWMVGKDGNQKPISFGSSNASMWSSLARNRIKKRRYVPFKQGYLFVMTLRAGEEGFQMSIDGMHMTSFAYRERLEPWLVNEVQISGDVDLISVLASGLPTSDDSENVAYSEALRSVPLPPRKPLNLFIGVFSTANNFKQRMAVRRTWMQYAAVRSGAVAVRFFVGLHKNQIVNEELLDEVKTYGDIQLMPFVDYYSLITWKTVAICAFGTQAVSANYVMKTDDDSFVRVNEVISSLEQVNVSSGLLYGLINSNAWPCRNRDSKWSGKKKPILLGLMAPVMLSHGT
ncbi:beta-1,3-galactosyltransferase GALT1-like isoform X2 [Diospyros lotus]|uniref:beta-1,3-galactosyltransferase GALT1-like isoform X2 n=1 Tax=Diospyros lotus TaxID=55363 RepID=UPI00224DA404|nr:beta-1,3-galactosyltransferase GALT1-like isoform X2 [Diospyros lotus]